MATKTYKVLNVWRVPMSADLLCICSSGGQHACCYCFRKGLIRKAHLCHNTKKWAAKHPEGWLAKSVPESFIFELDDIDYIEEALCDVPEVCALSLNHVHALAHVSCAPQILFLITCAKSIRSSLYPPQSITARPEHATVQFDSAF